MKKIVLSILILFMVFSTGRTNEPMPPPSYTYTVNGFLKCDTLTDKSFYTVVMYGRKANRDTEMILLRGLGSSYERPVSVTDSIGFFYLKVTHYELLDSIRLAVVFPGGAKIWGTAEWIDPSLIITNRSYYENNNNYNNDYGCNSCTEEVTAPTIMTSGFDYYLRETMLKLCN